MTIHELKHGDQAMAQTVKAEYDLCVEVVFELMAQRDTFMQTGQRYNHIQAEIHRLQARMHHIDGLRTALFGDYDHLYSIPLVTEPSDIWYTPTEQIAPQDVFIFPHYQRNRLAKHSDRPKYKRSIDIAKLADKIVHETGYNLD